jgi:hypothetical protein
MFQDAIRNTLFRPHPLQPTALASGTEMAWLTSATTIRFWSANELTVEASAIAPFIKKIAEVGFTGTATELLQRLND